MPAQPVLSPQLTQQYESLRDILRRSLALANRCSSADAARILGERLLHLQSAGLVVVIGETNSGAAWIRRSPDCSTGSSSSSTII